MPRTPTRRLLGTIGLVAFLAAPVASAQEAPPVRVRGTIERVDGQNLVVKSRDGVEVTVVLADNARIVGIVRASLAEIKPSSFVGITGMPPPDGSQRAVEVHVPSRTAAGLTPRGAAPFLSHPGNVFLLLRNFYCQS